MCSKHLQNVMDLFDNSNSKIVSLEDQLKIVKIMTLCSSENPGFRKAIGTYNNSTSLQTIVSLLDKGGEAAAVAAESIWILSFNDKHNHYYFVDNGAIPKMTKIIEQRRGDRDHYAILSAMWSAAALQNLAASYCGTESGHCWWEFDNHEGLHLHPESPLVINGSIAAEKIVNSSDGFVGTLNNLVCQGGMGPSDEIWPSLATIRDNMTLKMMTWAVAGLLKNLASYDVSEHAANASKHCLCLLTESEDWLVGD